VRPQAAQDRYSRQSRLPVIGESGQRRLADGHAVIVGCGALGCVSADLLARAGVGRLTLIDRDVVDASNLQRQSLYDERDAAEGLPKAEAAARRLRAVNSAIHVDVHVADLRASNAARVLGPGTPPGVIIDGTDNFETRYLLNDVSVSRGVPLVYGGVLGVDGLAAVFRPWSACLRCVFPEPPQPGSQPTCESAGVLGPAVWIVGAVQAGEAIKLLAGRGADALAEMVSINAWGPAFRRVALPTPRPDCPCCAQRRFEFLDGSRESDAEKVCGHDAVQVWPRDGVDLDLSALAARLASSAEVTRTPHMLRARVPGPPPIELSVFADSRAIIRGTTRPEEARAIYARFVGA
jgi:molybdopterin-synthase adenylyltransferase